VIEGRETIVCWDEPTPGDAPGTCDGCGAAVRIPRDRIALFGRKGVDGPRVLCTTCATTERFERVREMAIPSRDEVQETHERFKRQMAELAIATESISAGQRESASRMAALVRAFQDRADRVTAPCLRCGKEIRTRRSMRAPYCERCSAR
jgi:hypothetical protein